MMAHPPPQVMYIMPVLLSKSGVLHIKKGAFINETEKV